MTIETREHDSHREQQISDLMKQLRKLQMTYWLPGLDIGGKGDVEREVDQICNRLVELGVDLEALDSTETSASE